MKFVSRKQLEDFSANPTESALGFNLTAELDDAMNAGLKPIAKRLREYIAERDRLTAIANRWAPDALDAKLGEIHRAAQAGDEEASRRIESGDVPTKVSYGQMYAAAVANLESWQYNARGIFAEAAELIGPPMEKVVARAQAVLDKVLVDFGLPAYELRGASNHIAFLVEQLLRTSRSESADMNHFWGAFK